MSQPSASLLSWRHGPPPWGTPMNFASLPGLRAFASAIGVAPDDDLFELFVRECRAQSRLAVAALRGWYIRKDVAWVGSHPTVSTRAVRKRQRRSCLAAETPMIRRRASRRRVARSATVLRLAQRLGSASRSRALETSTTSRERRDGFRVRRDDHAAARGYDVRGARGSGQDGRRTRALGSTFGAPRVAPKSAEIRSPS